MVPSGKPHGNGIIEDRRLLFFPLFVLDDGGFMGTGKRTRQKETVLLYPFMDEVSVLLEADHETLFLTFLKVM